MSNNLEDLVPPLELCKKIPAGEFEDSVLAWMGNQTFENIIVRDVDLSKTFTPSILKTVVPAPTAGEIMKKLNYSVLECLANKSFVCHLRFGNHRYKRCQGNNSATAALKLWLNLKGIE
mgnify:CR=1 FL=1